ncbi:hypothetical protein ACNKHW_02585 [Shigella flexneri]
MSSVCTAFCGIVGCIMTGDFAASSLGGVGFAEGVTMGHQLLVQLGEVLPLRSSGPCRGDSSATNWRIDGWFCVYRKSRSEKGLDVNSHGENAYNA